MNAKYFAGGKSFTAFTSDFTVIDKFAVRCVSSLFLFFFVGLFVCQLEQAHNIYYACLSAPI